MTEEIIKSITDAEAQATEMKRIATERASKILSDAETQAERSEQSSAEVCKAYRESQIRHANSDAEAEYAAAMQKSEYDAKGYCTRAWNEAEVFIGTIVGRIISGDR